MWASGDGRPVGEKPRPWPDALLVERRRQLADRPEPQIIREDFADQRHVLRNDLELLADAAIAERNGSSDPNPLALGGGDLIAHPLADHLALELGEREQHIERQTPHARGRVEGLRHRDEGDTMLVKEFNQLGEVGERPCQPVDFVDDEDVDFFGPDLVQQSLQGWALERGAGKAAIVEFVADEPPAFMRLALDIGLASFALGVERVEGEIEIVLGRFARVDRAALRLRGDRLHATPLPPFGALTDDRGRTARCPTLPPVCIAICCLTRGLAPWVACAGWSLPRRPKKRGPFQLTPVIFRAIVERLA